ncbi:carbohydrate esterase family 5 protein [Hypoxylon rubiginosum]|uniref:Carbohydrate esterase family 5 protein n=1 Tax=Hypoxylon rubiginosum TaxID=110542 RepID=A0ACB9YTR8_9PEZI|nr:carbohydrate esterase family 5 protein [Hypoxylon rubiginosum]
MFAMPDLRRTFLTSASTAVYLLALFASAQETGSGACADVHVFLSRGNNEPYPGRQGKLVQAVCSGLDSCDYEDIAFDNALEVEYCSAIEAGRKAGIAQITAYHEKCPDAKLVVSGYSQGAHVVGDILGGGGGVFFQDCTTPTAAGLDPNSAPGNAIAAALLFGDTRHTAGQSFNTLAGAPFNGLFPRTGQQLAGLNGFAGVLRDWCQGDDPICAAGDGTRTYDVQHHLNYFDVYSGAAGEWVQSMLGETTSPSSSSTTALSTTTTSPEASSSTAIPTTTTTSSAAVSTSTSTLASILTLTSSSTTSSVVNSSIPTTSSSTPPTSTVSLTTLPEATNLSTTNSSSATPVNQGNGARVVVCLKLYLGLAALASVLFLIA